MQINRHFQTSYHGFALSAALTIPSRQEFLTQVQCPRGGGSGPQLRQRSPRWHDCSELEMPSPLPEPKAAAQ